MFIKSQLGDIFVTIKGQENGLPIVLWPSILTDHKIFDQLLSHLNSEYKFILIDGPGHGQSSLSKTNFTITECSEVLKQVLSELKIDQAVIGGTSWGGLVSADFAIKYPEKTKALILMNTPFYIDEDNLKFMPKFVAFGSRWLLKTKFFRNGVASAFFAKSILKENKAYAYDFHHMLKNANAKQISNAVKSVILKGKPLANDLSKISHPTLVVAGENDSGYPINQLRNAANSIPDSIFKVVPGKHISVIECPKVVSDIISDFLLNKKF